MHGKASRNFEFYFLLIIQQHLTISIPLPSLNRFVHVIVSGEFPNCHLHISCHAKGLQFQGSTFAVSAFALGKLFPSIYGCEVRVCSKLVHTSTLTLCALPFEVALIYVLSLVKAQRLGAITAEDSQRMVEEYQVEPSEEHCPEGFFSSHVVQQLAAQSLLTLSKSAGLSIAVLWVVTDLLHLLPTSPGSGSVLLGSVASMASLLVLLTELGSWLHWLPKSIKRIQRVATTASLSPQAGFTAEVSMRGVGRGRGEREGKDKKGGCWAGHPIVD